VAGCVLALQVAFTRFFSITIWHHFTYLVIGVALLGGGAAGVFLALRGWTPEMLKRRLGLFSLLFGLSVIGALLIVTTIEIDPLRLSQAVATMGGLAAYFVALFAMFFLGGLTIAAVFSAWGRDAHRLYFADLLGAAIGTLIVPLALPYLGAPALIITISLLTLVASLLFAGSRRVRWLAGGSGIALVVLVVWVMSGNELRVPVPQSKELGWALRNFGIAGPDLTRWNPVARVDVLPPITVDEPMIVGGIASDHVAAMRRANESFDLRIVTLDGTSMTGIYRFDGDTAHFGFFDHAVISAPYQIGLTQPSTLLIGVGGGLDILMARFYNAAKIVAVELNADVVRALRDDFADFSGNLATDPRTSIVVAEGRSYLIREPETYDIVQGIGLDNLAALSGGAYVLAESYIYTVDALEAALDRLTPRGVFSWTRDSDAPPREMLRLAGTAAEALRRKGIADPSRHIAIVENERGTIATLLVARAPFSSAAVERLRNWSASNGFRIQHDPLMRLATTYADYLHAQDPRAFEATYPYKIFPVTDDNPFFYSYFRWSSLVSSDGWSSLRGVRLPIGNFILIALLSMAVLASIVFVLFPLLRLRRDDIQAAHSAKLVSYFCLLGAAYIIVEIILIQRMTLFVGYPTLAITVTLVSMLLFSALGSLLGQHICTSADRLSVVFAILVGLIVVYGTLLPRLLGSLMGADDHVRILLGAGLIAPLAIVMGMPFPTGLRQLALTAPRLVPWAWGMNGVFSVLGSVVVVIVAIQTTFTHATWLAAAAYLVAALVAGALWQTDARSTTVAVPQPTSYPRPDRRVPESQL
jgi:hypothetical protein